MGIREIFKHRTLRCRHAWADWEIRLKNGQPAKWRGVYLRELYPEDTCWDADVTYYDWRRVCTLCRRYYIMLDNEERSSLRNDEYPAGQLLRFIDADAYD